MFAPTLFGCGPLLGFDHGLGNYDRRIKERDARPLRIDLVYRDQGADCLAISVTDQHASIIVLSISKMEEYSLACQGRPSSDLSRLTRIPDLTSEGPTDFLEFFENLTLDPFPTIKIANDERGCNRVRPYTFGNALHVVALRIGGNFLMPRQF